MITPNPGIYSVTAELTHQCNNRCIYCYQDKKPCRNIEPALLKTHIFNLRRTGARLIEFSGGEPTLSYDLLDFISFAAKARYENIVLLTNGRRLAYEDYTNALIKAGVKTFVLSLPAHSAYLYDKITKASTLGFKELLRAIKNIKKYPHAEMGSVTVLCKDNYDYLPEIVDQAVKLGLGFLTLTNLFPRDPTVPGNIIEPSDYERLSVSLRRLIPILKKILDRYEKKIKICIEGIPFCLMKCYESFILNESVANPGYLITPDGKVQKRSEIIQLTALKEKKCLSCIYISRCTGSVLQKRKDLVYKKIALDIQNGNCEYRCLFCSRQINGIRFKDLNKNIEKAVIDLDKIKLFFETSSKTNKHLNIWGREKIDEYNKLPDILKLAGESGFNKITLWSSGLRFNDRKYVKSLIAKGVTGFEMPVYGHSRSVHDRITCTNGAYTKLIAALKTLTSFKELSVSVHSVILSQNYETLPNLIEFFGLRYPRIALSLWFYYPDYNFDKQSSIQYKQCCVSFSKLIKSFETLNSKLPIKTIETAFIPLCILERLKKFYPGFKPIPMGAVRLYIFDKDSSRLVLLSGKNEFNAVFTDKCQKCSRKVACPGIFKAYLELFGSKEFVPY